MEYDVITPKGSHGSMTSGSNGLSTSPGSNLTDELKHSGRPSLSPTERHSLRADTSEKVFPSRAAPPPNGILHGQSRHVIRLSSIEHCMPRAYIRVCLAYPLAADVDFNAVIGRLNNFARRVVDSKPYLAGYVVPAAETSGRSNVAEIQFTDNEFLNYPDVQVRHLSPQEVKYSYDELNEQCLPPSIIKPKLISALPEGTDEEHSPVFRMQANVVRGGLIVSIYLHHCISDGAGLGSLITGKVLEDDFTFDRHLEAKGYITPGMHDRLSAWCGRKSWIRQNLSWSDGNQISDRAITHKTMSQSGKVNGTGKPSGCGCVLAFSKSKLEDLKKNLDREVPACFISPHDALCESHFLAASLDFANVFAVALLWQHMSIARQQSVPEPTQISKLLIPVNIRNKFKEPLSDSYFGAAVDFACAEMPLTHLSHYSTHAPTKLAETAVAIRHAIAKVDEPYIRQLIALANRPDPDVDVRDVMASNMDRVTGADMYITSWEKLGLYDATLGMGLGKPDWVRKPWSRDPGSCVVLPRDDRKSYIEVLVQMTEEDVAKLLKDETFMSYVVRTVDRVPATSLPPPSSKPTYHEA